MVDWDLNTGSVKRTFEGSGGQISALEIRPTSSLAVPEASGQELVSNGTFSTNSANESHINGVLTNGADRDAKIESENAVNEDAGSPADSLFGGNDADSLFGDNDEGEAGAPSGGNFADDDDDEFSRAIANGIQEQENEDVEGDVNMIDSGEVSTLHGTSGGPGAPAAPESALPSQEKEVAETTSSALTNGLPHAEELSSTTATEDSTAPAASDLASTAESTFLAASFDGTLRVWDKRKPTSVAKITPQNVPPWCMNACWSPDGNFIYAGRRNGTVEEFSLHTGLRGVERTFKFPNGSGPVSAVRAMPNGRHLIW